MKTLLLACWRYIIEAHYLALKETFNVIEAACSTQEHFKELALKHNPEVIILGFETYITENMLPFLTKLKAVIFPGTGIGTYVSTVIQEKLRIMGVEVLWLPGINAPAVAAAVHRRIVTFASNATDPGVNPEEKYIAAGDLMRSRKFVFFGSGATAYDNIVHLVKRGCEVRVAEARPKDNLIALGVRHFEKGRRDQHIAACRGADCIVMCIPDEGNRGILTLEHLEAAATGPDGKIDTCKEIWVIIYSRPWLIIPEVLERALAIFHDLKIAFDMWYFQRDQFEEGVHISEENRLPYLIACRGQNYYKGRLFIEWHNAHNELDLSETLSRGILEHAMRFAA